jgi:hypothetical protein
MVFAGSLDDRHQNVLPGGLRVHAFCGGGAARRGKERIVAVICSADTGISKRYLIFEGRLDTYPATSSGQDRFG